LRLHSFKGEKRERLLSENNGASRASAEEIAALAS